MPTGSLITSALIRSCHVLRERTFGMVIGYLISFAYEPLAKTEQLYFYNYVSTFTAPALV
jgi:hypothetical protein